MVVTTTRFEELTRQVAADLESPGLRVVAVPHPLGGTDADTVLDWADAAVDAVVDQLTD